MSKTNAECCGNSCGCHEPERTVTDLLGLVYAGLCVGHAEVAINNSKPKEKEMVEAKNAFYELRDHLNNI